MPEAVSLAVNGRTVTVQEGCTVATAVALSSAVAFRRSVTGQPRAPLCGMGICFECRVTVNGQPHARSCQIVCREGMDVRTDE
jgi:aerobic-type carbon monoxide dehydrogenase small subunit (CoxS/CutS family)